MSSNLVTTQSSAIFYIFTIVCFTMMVSSTGLKLESQRRNRSELGSLRCPKRDSRSWARRRDYLQDIKKGKSFL